MSAARVIAAVSEPAGAPAAPLTPLTPAAARPPSGGDCGARDVAPALADWPHEAGGVCARLVAAADDGRAVLQLRVELGVLQMECDARPDGEAFGRARTLLQAQREAARRDPDRFAADAEGLEAEGRLFARRYLAWFVLGEWTRAARDARHHLAVLDFLRRHADPAAARRSAGRWLPYALMMCARAESAARCAEGDVRGALRAITSAQRRLKRHFRSHGGREAYAGDAATAALRTVSRRLRKRLPETPARRLRRRLRSAVAAEDYERAASLRDELLALGRTL